MNKLIIVTLFSALILVIAVPDASAQAIPTIEIIDSQRTVLHEDIVHYTFDVDLGPEEFDTIRLHRVVRERHPGKPVATIDGIFMLPGAPNYFEAVFVPPSISGSIPQDHSIAVALAKNNVDVWGMDYAWALVPLETTEFGFMQDWGLERDIDYAEQALAVVRSIRVATGQGKPRLHVLGFSYGVPIAYAIAGNETQRPPGQRLVKGIISLDYDLKVGDETRRTNICIAAANGQHRVDAGNHANDDGAFLMLVGQLAKNFRQMIQPRFRPSRASPTGRSHSSWASSTTPVALRWGRIRRKRYPDRPEFHRTGTVGGSAQVRSSLRASAST